MLHIATGRANFDIVKILLENGADPNFPDYQNNTPFFLVFDREDATDLIGTFLEYGADIDKMNNMFRTPLPYIVQKRILSNEELRSLLSTVRNSQQKSINGGNLLHMVIDIHPDEEDGAFDDNDHFCEDYIHILYGNHSDIFPTWICELDEKGDTIMHLVSSAACVESIRYLLKSGADVNVKNYVGQTPLHYLAASAEYNGFSESLKSLLDACACIDERDNKGKTPLQYALSSEDSHDFRIVERLAQKGAKVTTTDIFKRNLLHTVLENGTSDVEFVLQCIDLLSSYGLDINDTDMFGFTPLHLAVSRKNVHTSIVEKCLLLGADVTIKSKTGDIALHRSCVRYTIGPTLIDWMSNHDMNIDHLDFFDSSPLHWAIWVREQVVIKHLLKKGADANIISKSEITAFDLARLLHFEQFDYLVGKSSPESNLCMRIGDVKIDYHGTDMFEECPNLSYIDKVDWKIELGHEKSLAKFVSVILNSPSMGYFYDLPEYQAIDDTIDEIIKNLSEYASEKNPIFSCDVRLAGSKNETTKIGVPNEYDYVWTLSSFQSSFFPDASSSVSPDVIKLKIKNDRKLTLQQYVDTDGYLESAKLNRAFYSIINEGLIKIFSDKSRDKFRNLYISELLDVSEGSLSCLQFTWVGPIMKLLAISVDIVPEIIIENWFPEYIDTGSSLFNTMMEHKKKHISVVMKTPDENFVPDWTRYFRLSFADWEQENIKRYPSCVIKGYILVKALIQSTYFPTIIDADNNGYSSDFITTYRVKTCFLHEIEAAESAQDQTLKVSKNQLSTSISLDWAKRILRRLQTSIDELNLPSFFCPKRNLLVFEGSSVVYSIEEYRALSECLHELLKHGTIDG